MDKRPHETPVRNTPLMTDRRGFLGAATAMGALAATTVQGTTLGVSAANAQTPAGGASRAAGPILTRTIGRTQEACRRSGSERS